ncbi:MAG: sodium-dependent transporter [Leptospirales bacterium]|nr:sodium-dependent transporter [Leptospirales bacterium]
MGSAIGLGNFLRFPGLAAQYGGGHFMIPYFLAFLLLGLPIAWAEWSMGRMGGRRGFNSSPGIFYTLWKTRGAAYVGVLGLLVPVGIYMFYVYIESWCLYYALQYLQGGLDLGQDPKSYVDFFSKYTGQNADGSLFHNGLATSVWMLMLCFALNFLIVYRGLIRGIEWVSRIAIPLLFLCAGIVLVRVLTLGAPDPALPDQNVLEGLGFMWNPDRNGISLLQNLSQPRMWIDAAGQVFFSLSVGFGIIITYASYVRAGDDVALSSLTSASGNMFAEVALGGLITIPTAFIFLGQQAERVASKGSLTLGFMAMPNIFANMPLGSAVGFFWFFLLFVAAITSSISMLQPAIAFLEEGLGIGRRVSVALLAFITAVGCGFVVQFSEDLRALDYLNFWVGTLLIYVLATILVIFFARVIGVDAGMDEAERGGLIHIPRVFRFILKYVSPLYLIVLFGAWLYYDGPAQWEKLREDEVARYTVFFVLFLGGFFATLVAAAVRRWRALEAGQ